MVGVDNFPVRDGMMVGMERRGQLKHTYRTPPDQAGRPPTAYLQAHARTNGRTLSIRGKLYAAMQGREEAFPVPELCPALTSRLAYFQRTHFTQSQLVLVNLFRKRPPRHNTPGNYMHAHPDLNMAVNTPYGQCCQEQKSYVITISRFAVSIPGNSRRSH